MNRSAYQLILAAITLLISTTAHGAGVYLKVNGYDDTTGQTTILVTNGFDAYVGSVVAHTHDSHEERDQIDTDPDTGEPIYGDWYTVWDEPIYTIYHASVPGEWLGLGFSFSSDGTGWTPFLPFVEDDETHEITAFDWNGLGQRATPSPNFNVTTQGNRINLGRWWGDASRPVFTLKSWDNDNMYWPCVGMDFTASTSNVFWRWFHPTDDGLGAQLAMDLDHRHRLTLRGRSGPGTIVLDPNQAVIRINGEPLLTPSTAGQSFVRLDSPSRVNLGMGTSFGGGAFTVGGALILGKFNDIRWNDAGVDHRRGVLIVGNGTGTGNDANTRKNGLRILDDGTVLIRPKGDLAMDPAFTAGPQP